MALKLLNAVALGGWFNSARVATSPQNKSKNAVVALREYKRNCSQHAIAEQHFLNQRLYDEESITSLTYANKLYKRLPIETMAEFHARVLRTQ